jgi:hypothetical protein
MSSRIIVKTLLTTAIAEMVKTLPRGAPRAG